MRNLIILLFIFLWVCGVSQHHMMHPVPTSNNITEYTWNFPSDTQVWVYHSTVTGESGFWSLFTIVSNLTGGPMITTGSYWYWQGTWEDLGVTPGNTVTDLKVDYQWRCSNAFASEGWGHGPAELRSSGGTTLIGTSSTLQTGAGVTSFAYEYGSSVPVTSGYQASSTTIQIRIGVILSNGFNVGATTRLEFSPVKLYITNN